MKSGALAVVVAVVFVLGVVAGAAFFASQGGGESAVAQQGATAPDAEDGPRERVSPDARLIGSSNGTAQGGGDAAPTNGGGNNQPPPLDPPQIPGGGSGPPPKIPGLPSPDALKEAKRIGEERAQLGDEGHGDTRALVYEFESEEARLEHEASRRANWEARLTRENDIKLKALRESVGLSSGQETQLKEILAKELAERMRLVDGLANKELTRSTFDQGIKDNVAAARQALQALLTPEQFEAYAKLKPREQVLQDETK